MGLEVGKIIEKQEPVIRDDNVCGIEGTCILYDVNGVERIILKFLAGIDFEDYDEVKIIGLPEMYWRSWSFWRLWNCRCTSKSSF